MSITANEICEQAKDLPDIEKLAIVDALLAQLDLPAPTLDAIWAKEASARRRAYHEGRLGARDFAVIMTGFDHR